MRKKLVWGFGCFKIPKMLFIDWCQSRLMIKAGKVWRSSTGQRGGLKDDKVAMGGGRVLGMIWLSQEERWVEVRTVWYDISRRLGEFRYDKRAAGGGRDMGWGLVWCGSSGSRTGREVTWQQRAERCWCGISVTCGELRDDGQFGGRGRGWDENNVHPEREALGWEIL